MTGSDWTYSPKSAESKRAKPKRAEPKRAESKRAKSPFGIVFLQLMRLFYYLSCIF